MKLKFDTLFKNAHLATLDPAIPEPYGAIKNGALGVKDGQIVWRGKESDIPAHKAKKNLDCEGGWITPGLVDCHTHLVFAGDRAREFEMRLSGARYEDIAKNGGGILSTVRQTRAATFEDLILSAGLRLINMMSRGVTTIEIKSGYGLNYEAERKMLQVARTLEKHHDIRIQTTFLGAHALPPEFEGRSDAYIDLICEDMLPRLAADGLVDAVDGFCETIGFSPKHIERVFQTAHDLDLPVKLHAEQLSNQGGAKLAAQYKALSADHLEYLDESGVKAMAKAGTIAVLLPGAFYFLKETKKPPIALLKKYNVPIALATDCNPGSAPISSAPLILNMACTLFGLTPRDALMGMSINGAKALGLGEMTGSLEIGKSADLAIWPIDHPSTLSYWLGDDFWPLRVFKGKICD